MDSAEAKENIHKVTNFTFGADTFLVVGADEKSGWVRSCWIRLQRSSRCNGLDEITDLDVHHLVDFDKCLNVPSIIRYIAYKPGQWCRIYYDVCPDCGSKGGNIIFSGTPAEMLRCAQTVTLPYLEASLSAC